MNKIFNYYIKSLQNIFIEFSKQTLYIFRDFIRIIFFICNTITGYFIIYKYILIVYYTI